MISFIRGRLVDETPTHAIVDCNGVGYELRISANTYDQLDEEAVTLLAHYAVSVDVRSGASAHQLFGFITKLERDLFRQLITVSGVSSTIAMTILSTMDTEHLQQGILNGDDKLFKSVKGIGPKLAQRIVMELGEKILLPTGGMNHVGGGGNMDRQEALAALCSLGFDRKKADKTLNSVVKDSKSKMSVEEMIKKSLQAL